MGHQKALKTLYSYSVYTKAVLLADPGFPKRGELTPTREGVPNLLYVDFFPKSAWKKWILVQLDRRGSDGGGGGGGGGGQWTFNYVGDIWLLDGFCEDLPISSLSSVGSKSHLVSYSRLKEEFFLSDLEFCSFISTRRTYDFPYAVQYL